MTNHIARLYAVALALVVFFLTWAVVSARPWAAQATPAGKDPRIVALERREVRLHRESIRVQRLVKRRFHVYKVRLRARKHQIAAIETSNARAAAAALAATSAPSWTPSAAPSVSVVSAPPVTSTKSS